MCGDPSVSGFRSGALGFMLLTAVALPGFAQDAHSEKIPDKNPYTTPADVIRGKQLSQGQCATCHGPGGDGGRGANLARAKLPRAKDDRALFLILREGLPGTEM